MLTDDDDGGCAGPDRHVAHQDRQGHYCTAAACDTTLNTLDLQHSPAAGVLMRCCCVLDRTSLASQRASTAATALLCCIKLATGALSLLPPLMPSPAAAADDARADGVMSAGTPLVQPQSIASLSTCSSTRCAWAVRLRAAGAMLTACVCHAVLCACVRLHVRMRVCV